MKKTRFDYNNPETCMLSLSYVVEEHKCPECLAELSESDFNSKIEDFDFLVLLVKCPKCHMIFEYGSVLDNSNEANEIRSQYGVPIRG